MTYQFPASDKLAGGVLPFLSRHRANFWLRILWDYSEVPFILGRSESRSTIKNESYDGWPFKVIYMAENSVGLEQGAFRLGVKVDFDSLIIDSYGDWPFKVIFMNQCWSLEPNF